MANQVFGVQPVGQCLRLLPLPSACFGNAVSKPGCPITAEQILASPAFPPLAPGTDPATVPTLIAQCEAIPVTPVSGSLAPLRTTCCINPTTWRIQTVNVNINAFTVDTAGTAPVVTNVVLSQPSYALRVPETCGGCNYIESNISLIFNLNLPFTFTDFSLPVIEFTICRINPITGRLENIPDAPCSQLITDVAPLLEIVGFNPASGESEDSIFPPIFSGSVSGIICVRPGDLLVPCIRSLSVVVPTATAEDLVDGASSIILPSEIFITQCATLSLQKIGECPTGCV